ncbi:hypothetical protein QUH73_05795 [Labilibaculum sp. K2S]|uniref:hypothetical protein n=1 Tax=Labilibaculum sp. K2S TaxID=3056386 RepID=UPI0025A47535|nr:hypothetical protein [Labilibaculum sp. K2S]MDM8159324.1 hypothetical protein [Labilibaculum sp. K2S]
MKYLIWFILLCFSSLLHSQILKAHHTSDGLNNTVQNDYYTYDYNAPTSLSNVLNAKGKSLTDWIKPMEGQALTFMIKNPHNGKEYQLIPLYNLYQQ